MEPETEINGENNNNGESATSTASSSGDNSKTNLIINYLPQKLTDDEFRNLFTHIGPIKTAKIIRHKASGYSYGFGFVDYQTPDDAARAIDTLNGTLVEHKKIKVAYAKPGGDQSKVQVKNFPPNMKEDDLKGHFVEFGTIIHCRVDRGGVASIIYETGDQADQAIKSMHGKCLPESSKALDVQIAGPDSDGGGKFKSNKPHSVSGHFMRDVENDGKLISSDFKHR